MACAESGGVAAAQLRAGALCGSAGDCGSCLKFDKINKSSLANRMNPIKNIEIKNFKSIRHQKIDGCKKINVFIGYPNVGKSNILEPIGLYTSLRLIEENFKFNNISTVKRL